MRNLGVKNSIYGWAANPLIQKVFGANPCVNWIVTTRDEAL